MQIFLGGVIYPLILYAAKRFIDWSWSLENVFPIYLRQDSGLSLAFKCSVFSLLPMFLIISLDILNKLFFSQGIFTKANEFTLQDTMENTLLFLINLLAASTLKWPSEKLMIITTVFILSRTLYWFGFTLGVYLKIPELKYVGVSLTLVNTLSLIFANLQTLVI